MPIHEYTTEINTLVFEDAVQDLKSSSKRNNKKLRVENQNRITTRHRRNSEWLQLSGNTVKPENDTKLKIIEFQEKCHKPSLLQRLEQLFNVTTCNEKCNFFILLQCVSLLRSILLGLIPHRKGRISSLVQSIKNGKIKEFHKYMIYEIYSNILLKWMNKIIHFQTNPNQWNRRKVKDTKFIIHANSCNLNKLAVNPV